MFYRHKLKAKSKQGRSTGLKLPVFSRLVRIMLNFRKQKSNLHDQLLLESTYAPH
jgi:hypothetical protein